ncbi:ribonuclease Y [Erysipelotrichaceae bacterium]|nr:ribonuclease Y [Erysipelotrichaceae bacterium]
METIIIIGMVALGAIMAVISYNYAVKQEQKKQVASKQTAADLTKNANREIEANQKVAILETREKLRILETQKNQEFDMREKALFENKNTLHLLEKELAFEKVSLEKFRAEVLEKQVKIENEQKDFLGEQEQFEITAAAAVVEQENLITEIAELSKLEAREIVFSKVKETISVDVAKLIQSEEEKAKHQIKQKGKRFLIQAMQRYTSEVATEATVSVVTLPNDDLKGRLIGREGRNIRSIETLTGVDVIIDDTPEAVVLSCFDPIRRELARMMVQELVDDGRIHPGRIEEVFAQKQAELDVILVERGDAALVEMNLPNMDEDLVKLFGKLHFRTSYGQNILQHSKEVGFIAGVLAAELGEDVTLARRAGLLHDIGKAVDFEHEGSHVELGVKIAKKFHESEVVINAIASHHGDEPATSIISELVAIADGLSATRPGARRESLESYIKRLTELENISTSFPGVQKAYAIQAGREIRVLVNPESTSDKQTEVLAFEIRKKIEDTLQYPGTIKVTVIREKRAIDVAK